VLRARDLMTRSPITVPAALTIGELCDLLQVQNINGAPVVDGGGRLLGVVTQEDIIYGTMGHVTPGKEPPPKGKGGRPGKRVVQMLRERTLQVVPPADPARGARPFWADTSKMDDPMKMPVSSVMTSPAISAEEDTPVTELCHLMWSLRIHRVPILKDGRVTGLVSSMDLCRAILEGTIKL
jgi:CBS domain-containing protein